MGHSVVSSKTRVAGLEPQKKYIILVAGLIAGYVVGMVLMETADVMFTSGAERTLITTDAGGSSQQVAVVSKPEGHTIHSVLTSNGSPYQNFQSRIMYGTYKLVAAMPGGENMAAFTRVLHRTTEDELMEEIPTFHAKPLHPECDTYCDFPVADRGNAVVQWIQAVEQDPSLLKGAWILLLEADYVWMKPLQAPDAASNAPGLQYQFGYIQPQHPNAQPIISRLFKGGDVALVPPSGPAPVLMRWDDFRVVARDWEKVTADLEADAEAVKVLGWVREMYAWDIAVAMHPDVKMLTQGPYDSPLIVQPPSDDHLGNAAMCHYTWGAIYNDTKGEVWRWEKRDYTGPQHALKVPLLKMPPHPFKPDTWHLQAHEPVTELLHTTLEAMIAQMNRAIEKLPDLSNKAPRRRLGRML